MNTLKPEITRGRYAVKLALNGVNLPAAQNGMQSLSQFAPEPSAPVAVHWPQCSRPNLGCLPAVPRPANTPVASPVQMI